MMLLAIEKQKPKNYLRDSAKIVVQCCSIVEIGNKNSVLIAVAVNGGRSTVGLRKNRLDFTSKESDECDRRQEYANNENTR